MKGLAQSLAQPQPQSTPHLEQIIALLLEGANPEQLVQMGIPPELIMQAIEMIEQQMQAQGAAASPVLPAQTAHYQEPGLAHSMGIN